MRYRGWTLALVLLAGGCLGKQPDPGKAEDGQGSDIVLAVPAEEASAAATETPAAKPAGRSVKLANDLYEFAYSYPDAAGAIPGLRDMLDGQLARARSELADSAREDRTTAQKDGYVFNPHSHSVAWATVADLPDWLSLSAEIYTFSGGAHGMSNFAALLWDRRTGTARKPRDLFTSPDALRAAIREPFCDALDREREQRRGEAVERDSEQMFSECIDPVVQTVILGSSNHRTFDRIGVLVAPYEAGPYAEGSYEVTLPVTGAVMAAVKPQYRGSFSAGR